MKCRLLSLIFLALSACNGPGQAEADVVVSIVIHYEYLGWGSGYGSVEEWHWIRPRGDGEYSIESTFDGVKRAPIPRPVSASAVRDLLVAVRAPHVARPEAAEELASNFSPTQLAYQLTPWRALPTHCDSEKLRRWANEKIGRSGIRSLIDRHLATRYPWTDDSPEMTITIQFDDGRKAVLQSSSQLARMLPWSKLTGKERGRDEIDAAPKTWSLELSRSVANVLPYGEPSRARFQDPWLERQLALQLEREQVDACSLEATRQLPGSLDFKVLKAASQPP